MTVSTVNNLLIPGDGTKGAESTTTTVASLAKAKGGLSDDQLIVARRRRAGAAGAGLRHPHLAVLVGHPPDGSTSRPAR